MTRHAINIFAVPIALALAFPLVALAQEGHGEAVAADAPHGGAAVAAPAHGAAAAAAVVEMPASNTEEHGASPHWGYEAPVDASVWAELSNEFKTCGTGIEQSPIDIDDDELTPSSFEPVGLHWLPFKPGFLNNGHTLQVNTNGAGGYAELGGDRFELLQFHFHHLSEHTLNGDHAQMEVHFVHANSEGKLLVIGAMVALGDANPDIALLWTDIPVSGDEIALEAMIDPLNLVPRDHTSYRYAGSLTTPPCSEIVTWNVYTHPVTFSSSQVNAFSSQYHNNARPTQPLNRRYVLTD